MGLKLRKSDAEQAFQMLQELVGSECSVYWEFHDAAETIFFSVRPWSFGQDGHVRDIGRELQGSFDKWFPPQEGDYTWMITFFAADDRCSGVLICGLDF